MKDINRHWKKAYELLLVRQLQIILGEKLFGPQARLRITPIAWFEPATSMTSLASLSQKVNKIFKRSVHPVIFLYLIYNNFIEHCSSVLLNFLTISNLLLFCRASLYNTFGNVSSLEFALSLKRSFSSSQCDLFPLSSSFHCTLFRPCKGIYNQYFSA